MAAGVDAQLTGIVACVVGQSLAEGGQKSGDGVVIRTTSAKLKSTCNTRT
jgi:hypothetical protein